ncbi:MAG TPA: hypothetical protein VFH61_06205 [Thermoleophilia bacterium]|nr:hypothetical protein [Thermoleophilia bacterium]
MNFRRVLLSVSTGALVLLCLPSAASAAAVVDDPGVADQIPSSAQAYFAEREAQFQQWLGGRSGMRVASRILDAPHRILSTTSHKQIRNDYCVPATTTIIDHFLRGARAHWSQNRWAAYMYNGIPLWTDAYGGNMWVMALGLKAKTGKGYTYSNGNTALSVYDRTEYAIKSKSRPVGYGLRIYSGQWPNYRINHVGHILCGRGFDWRYGLIYVDDPYPENAVPPLGYGSAGGATYGKKTYERDVVAAGVMASASQQVVY